MMLGIRRRKPNPQTMEDTPEATVTPSITPHRPNAVTGGVWRLRCKFIRTCSNKFEPTIYTVE